MTWIALPPQATHQCRRPMRTWSAIPSPDGPFGALWRCDDCRRLWRVGRACATCDVYGEHMGGGQCMAGTAWRPATLWQRIKRRRSPARSGL